MALPVPDCANVIYETLESAETAIVNSARQNGYAIHRLRSKATKDRVIRKVWLCCAHAREYKPSTSDEKRMRQTTTRRMNCPWSAVLQLDKGSGTWVVEIKHDFHNHERSSNMAAYPSARVLTPGDIDTIKRMSHDGATPKEVLSALRQGQPDILVTARDIYNLKKTLRDNELHGRTPVEAFLDELEDKGVMNDHKRDQHGHVTHLFFAPTKSVALAREFPGVLLMDTTFKTNRFKMPLLHVVGMTSTNMSFTVCFCFMKGNTEDDYIWALERVWKCFNTRSPSVIVTDKELPLMTAINRRFPEVVNLLCAWHIEKDIVAKIKSSFATKEGFDRFLTNWNMLVSSIDEDTFSYNWSTIMGCCDTPQLVYLHDTWIVHKEKFVLAWTKNAMHFGHLTSKVQGKLSTVKCWINASTGDLKDVYEKISAAIQHQENDIRQQIAYDRSTLLTSHSHPIWTNVRRVISHFALKKTFKEFQKAKTFFDHQDVCFHVTKNSMGLPCAHMLKNLLDRNEQLDRTHFHEHWWLVKPTITINAPPSNPTFQAILGHLEAQYNSALPHRQHWLEQQLSQLSHAMANATEVLDPQPIQSACQPTSAIVMSPSTAEIARDPSTSSFELIEEEHGNKRKCSDSEQPCHNKKSCSYTLN